MKLQLALTTLLNQQHSSGKGVRRNGRNTKSFSILLFLPCPQSSPVKPGAHTQRYRWSVNPDWQVELLWHGLTSQALFQETNER